MKLDVRHQTSVGKKKNLLSGASLTPGNVVIGLTSVDPTLYSNIRFYKCQQAACT